MTERDREKAQLLKELTEKVAELSSRIGGAAVHGGASLFGASAQLSGIGDEIERLARELDSDREWNATGIGDEDMAAIAAALDLAGRDLAAFEIARQGEVVATAEFDPGIAPFTLEVRKVPVPVTNSSHFIVSLHRGQYVVTSFRYFWPDYTPGRVVVSWPCVNRFTVTFDDTYEASCEWSWGAGASWSITVPEGRQKPGLSAYFFTPRNPLPPGCPDIALE